MNSPRGPMRGIGQRHAVHAEVMAGRLELLLGVAADDHTPHSNWTMDVVRVNREIGARSASGFSCSL